MNIKKKKSGEDLHEKMEDKRAILLPSLRTGPQDRTRGFDVQPSAAPVPAEPQSAQTPLPEGIPLHLLPDTSRKFQAALKHGGRVLRLCEVGRVGGEISSNAGRYFLVATSPTA